jgi:hypothetical protein
MNRAWVIVASACLFDLLAPAPALAADAGIYGVIDIARFPKPELVNHKAVVADSARLASSPARAAKSATLKPLYLHVPPGHVAHWQAHCASYDACGVPVLFVTEGWFVNVYLPAIGSMDGREQRYREQMARDRSAQRDAHAERSDD